ncbi:MAG: hypothetical protein CTY20_00725 [Hyphomicrobium sp.]|nr:MAG: hypothetical protein CTY20_00725 [Hyphomicrobium sp.]
MLRAGWQRWIGGLVLGALLVLPGRATAEPRIALVIANQGYTQPGAKLTNTHRDGDLVKAALEKVGFKVTVVRDTRSEGALLAAIGEHVERLAVAGPDAVGFLYYSGHGAADRPDGANYLIPTEAPLTHVTQLPLMAVRLDRITATLAGAAKMSFVVFDACRNVALQRDGKDFGFKGFAPIREQRGLLVAYATEPGNVAVDQSIYAKALAEEIVKPGLEAGQVFRTVTQKVEAATDAKQSPEFLDKRRYDFHFAAASASAPLAAAKSETQVAAAAPPAKPDLHQPIKPVVGIVTPPAGCSGIEAAVFGTTQCLQIGNTFTDCHRCPEMVVVPAGSFLMGSPESDVSRRPDEGPQRRVTIARPFAVGRYEVAFAEWDACVADGGCTYKPRDEGWGRGRRPVMNVSWNDAQAYVRWIRSKTGAPYRLLSEAEWEYAARGGTTTAFSFGETIKTTQAQFSEGKVGSAQKTVEVGTFKPNAFGLFDMHGNVWEWVEDCYAATYANAPTDGSQAPDEKDCSRVLRGGSWGNSPQHLRSAVRLGDPPDHRIGIHGFRLARTLNPTP